MATRQSPRTLGSPTKLKATKSIYEKSTVTVTSSYGQSTAVSLKLLDLEYVFTRSFLSAYVDKPPVVNGVDSPRFGILPESEQRCGILNSYLDRVYIPGENASQARARLYR